MEMRTFILRGKLALTVPEASVKLLETSSKSANIVISLGGCGNYQAGLDVTRLAGMSLEEMASTLGNDVFRFDLPLAITSLNRLDEAGNVNKGGTSPATVIPVGPTLK